MVSTHFRTAHVARSAVAVTAAALLLSACAPFSSSVAGAALAASTAPVAAAASSCGPTAAAPTPAPGSGSGTGSATDWSKATAILTDTKGKATMVKADSLAYCISVGHGINLSGRQDIAFDKITRIEVTRVDPLFTTDGVADVTVTLLSGDRLTGTVGGNCDFFGLNDVGRFSLYPQELKSIEIRR